MSADSPVVLLRIALIVDGWRCPDANIINLAEEGLFLETSEPLPLGRRVELRLVTGDDRVCEAQGSVVWRADIGVGIRLPEPSDEFRYFVRELAAVGFDERRHLVRSVREPAMRVN